MSLWLHRRDVDGNVHHYAIPFDPLVFIAILGILMGLTILFVLAFRNLVLLEPVQTAVGIAAGLVVGLTLVGIAKLSVMGAGSLVTFGPSQMTRSMRLLYGFGYAIMGCAALLAILFIVSI